jgi:hypothetical protein
METVVKRVTAKRGTARQLPAPWREYDVSVMRLEEPSRRILVEIVLPAGPETTEPAAEEEPEKEPQPQS